MFAQTLNNGYALIQWWYSPTTQRQVMTHLDNTHTICRHIWIEAVEVAEVLYLVTSQLSQLLYSLVITWLATADEAMVLTAECVCATEPRVELTRWQEWRINAYTHAVVRAEVMVYTVEVRLQRLLEWIATQLIALMVSLSHGVIR